MGRRRFPCSESKCDAAASRAGCCRTEIVACMDVVIIDRSEETREKGSTEGVCDGIHSESEGTNTGEDAGEGLGEEERKRGDKIFRDEQ